MQRKIETVNRARVGREGVKGRDLEQKYPPEKAKKLMELLRQRGLWYWDDDFPKDEEDHLKTFQNKTSPIWFLNLMCCFDHKQSFCLD